MSFAVMSLAGLPDWLPEHLAGASLSWPNAEFPTPRLRDIAQQLSADTFAGRGTATITPNDIDPDFGGLRRRSRTFSGPAFQVRDGGRGLAPGDLLVPPQARIPVLRVLPRHIGSLVSASFTAVRPNDGISLWLWALLSSETGTEFRASLSATGNARMSFRASLLDLEVPLPPLDYIERVGGELKRIEDGTIWEEEEPAASWWRMTALDSGDWQLKVSTPDPSLFHDGVPLEDLCRDIAVGRNPHALSTDAIDARTILPLATTSSLSGRKEPPFVDSETSVVADPGDVLVAAVGTRPYATPVLARTAVGQGVMALRLVDPERANAISRFLNSASGQSLRRMLSTSVAIPSISRKSLGMLPVPPGAVTDSAPDATPLLIAPTLERVLWG